MKKNFIISWCIVFIMFFLSPHIMHILFGQTFSENTENREMTEFPDISLQGLTSFPSGFEKYYNDALPFRNNIITFNSYINCSFFRESPVSNVIIGNDNWLFYNPNGSDGDPIGDLNGKTHLTSDELSALLDNLLEVNQKLEAQGKTFVIYIAPNKESIYGNNYLPDFYKSNTTYTTADQVVDYIKNNSDLRVVYPKSALITAIKDFPECDFYYNTDTHWNDLGGYIGAKCLIEELGGQMENISHSGITYDGVLSSGKDLAKMMALSSYVKEENPYKLTYTPVSEIIVSEKEANTEYRFITNSSNEQKLFIIRDSFCTAMAEHIAPYFSESIMVHNSIYTPAMILEENPDIVVYQVVERYLRKLLTFNVE